MSFYQSFASYYDRIFPLNQTALSFVSNYFQPGESILDMGAGTGNMAIALADKEIEVTASEPDETMAESIRSKTDMKWPNIICSDEINGTDRRVSEQL